MHVLIASFRATPRPETAAWRADEVEFRSVEFDMEAEKAAEYIRRRAAGHAGWRVLVRPPVIAP
jgi:hypothetical protein